MKFLITAAVVLVSVSAAQAALAPNYQRANEFSAIANAVAELLPQQTITKIIYRKPDQYTVVAGPCSLRADIVTKPQPAGFVGPRAFDVKLTKPKC